LFPNDSIPFFLSPEAALSITLASHSLFNINRMEMTSIGIENIFENFFLFHNMLIIKYIHERQNGDPARNT